MALRSDSVTVNDREILVKELSMAGQLRLESLDRDPTFEDLWCECISKSDREWIEKEKESIGRWDYRALREIVVKLNENPIKTEMSPEDALVEEAKKEVFREPAEGDTDSSAAGASQS